MTFKTNLLEKPTATWRVHHTFTLDWRDGPIEGFCHLSTPECAFFFTLIAEWMDPDGLDDRLFLIGEVQRNAIDSIVKMLETTPPPTAIELAPRWEFKSVEQRQRIEAQMVEIISSITPPFLVIRTPNMRQFFGVWNYHGRQKLR